MANHGMTALDLRLAWTGLMCSRSLKNKNITSSTTNNNGGRNFRSNNNKCNNMNRKKGGFRNKNNDNNNTINGFQTKCVRMSVLGNHWIVPTWLCVSLGICVLGSFRHKRTWQIWFQTFFLRGIWWWMRWRVNVFNDNRKRTSAQQSEWLLHSNSIPTYPLRADSISVWLLRLNMSGTYAPMNE